MFKTVPAVHLCGELPTCFYPLPVSSSCMYMHALSLLSGPLKTSEGGSHVLIGSLFHLSQLPCKKVPPFQSLEAGLREGEAGLHPGRAAHANLH